MHSGSMFPLRMLACDQGQQAVLLAGQNTLPHPYYSGSNGGLVAGTLWSRYSASIYYYSS